MARNEQTDEMPSGWRFPTGIGLFVLGWILPGFVPLVAVSSLSFELKAAISSMLVVGGPEICGLASIAVLGRDGFNYIKSFIFTYLKRAAPSAQVSRARYRIGLCIWCLLALFNYLIFYAPDLIPGYEENRLSMNLVADFIFIASFFVLGGDFWEKFRALFIYEAKAVIPEKKKD